MRLAGCELARHLQQLTELSDSHAIIVDNIIGNQWARASSLKWFTKDRDSVTLQVDSPDTLSLCENHSMVKE